ncbi:hypothetical protein ANCCEY_02521 [Ancylostoma ceylanicum]|uniref:Uncharacterized protein n=1 Tax=Ancylostoma ceylanicum TaxID=53326 RepID=A0A0D6MC65_9BILA|nr:hypothetical protein ANCCEY_02521 [Ancylostoma ceylanicum]
MGPQNTGGGAQSSSSKTTSDDIKPLRWCCLDELTDRVADVKCCDRDCDMNVTLSEEESLFFIKLSFYSSILLTMVSIVALAVNLYLLNLEICKIVGESITGLFAIPPQADWRELTVVFKLATFFASVFTMLALALNHYIGIVYPLHR